MRNYIILNGKNSNQINGLLIQELPPISKPLIRTETEEIDGRDGDIVTPLGYSAYDKELTIGLYKDFDVNEVAAYFNSEGTVIFSNEPDKYYYYQITAQIDFERLVRYRTATVTMHCQPFKYSATEQPITEDVSGTVSGEGTNIVLENSAEAPFSRFDLKGNTEQTTYSGKNLFGAASLADLKTFNTSGTWSGNAFTKNGLTFTVIEKGGLVERIEMSGTATANTTFTIIRFDRATFVSKITTGSTYTLSGCPSGGSNTTYYLRLLEDPYRGLCTDTGSSYHWTAPEITSTANYVGAVIGVDNGTNMSGKVYRPMLESGSTATTFEPYVGGTASPNPDYPQNVKVVTGENVVKISGKNLFAYPDHMQTSGGGLTYTLNSDGSITFEGVLTTNNYHMTTNQDITSELEDGATYSLSKSDYDAGSAVFLEVRARKTGTTSYVYYSARTGASNFTVDKTTYDQYLIWVIGTTAAWGNQPRTITSNFQLEKGSTATSFKPYQGQSYEVNLGKNLFDKDNANVINGQLTPEKTLDTSTGKTVWIPCEPNTTYTLSKAGGNRSRLGTSKELLTTSNTLTNYVAEATDIGGGRSKGTITSGAQDKYLYYTYSQTDNQSILESIQIEKGSTATTYAPYFTPIELCGLGDDGAGGYLYQNYIYKNLTDNKWYVRKEVGKTTFTSTTAWTKHGTTNGNVFMLSNTGFIGYGYGAGNAAPALMDTARVIKLGSMPDSSNGVFGINDNSQLRVFRGAYDASYTAGTFKAEMVGHYIYGALATPTDTEITNEALIAQLDDIYNQAHAYKERTHVSSTYATGNVPHIIAAEVGEDNESTITNAGNYLSKPKITVYGSGDIGLYINGMQALQITLGDEGYITIDTAQMEAYKDTLDNLKNRLVIGDYSNARLKPGANKIHFTGTVTKYVVENYSRWL